MATVDNFEDMKVWQKARTLSVDIYKLSQKPEIKNDFALKDQLQRTGVSVMANIAEGFERYSKKEFIRFLYIAKGSAGELRSHLYIVKDLSYIDQKEFEKLKDKCEEVSRMISGFITYLGSAENINEPEVEYKKEERN